MLNIANALRTRTITHECLYFQIVRFYVTGRHDKPDFDPNELKYLIANRINKDKQKQASILQEHKQDVTRKEVHTGEIVKKGTKPQNTNATPQRRKLRTIVRGGSKEKKEETSAEKQIETKDWMEQRKKTLLSRLQPKASLIKKDANEGEGDEEGKEEGEEEEGREEEEEEEGELDEAEPEEDTKKPKKEKRMTLQQIRAKKRELLRRKRIGEVVANDTREYDNPTHWRTIAAMAPPDDDYPETLKLRAEKLGEEIRKHEKSTEKSALCAPLFFKRGVMLMQCEQHVAARGDLEQCIFHLAKSNCQDVNQFDHAYHMLAICLAFSKEFDKAFKVASTISQVFVRVNVLASILMYNQQYEKAIKYLKLLSEIFQHKSADVYFHLGKCYKAQEKKQLALAEFTKAVAENPTNLQYRIAKATQLKEGGKIGEAKRELKDVVLSREMDKVEIDSLVKIYCEEEELCELVMQHIAEELRGKTKATVKLGEIVHKIEQMYEEEDADEEEGEYEGEGEMMDIKPQQEEFKENPYIFFSWGCQLLKLQKWAVAIKNFDAVLKFPKSETKLLENAKKFTEMAKEKLVSDTKILEFLNQKQATHPDTADIYIERAAVLFRRNELDKALEDTQTALSMTNSAKIYHLRALIYEEKRDYKQAAENFLKAGEIEGKEKHQVHAEIDAMYARSQEYESVVDEYTIAIAYAPLPEYFVNKANAYAELDNYTDAVMTLTDGMGLVNAKHYPSMYMLRAKYNHKLKDLIHATKDINIAFESFPKAADPEWFSTRAAINYSNNMYSEAISDCDYAISHSTILHPFRLCNCYMIKAKTSIDKKMFEYALTYINEALKYDLEVAECLYLRGRVYTNQGKYLQALADFNNALSGEHSGTEELAYLILAYRGFINNCLERKEESERDWNMVIHGGNTESRQLISNWQQVIEGAKNITEEDEEEEDE
eukprot:Phypoly_transcript_02069.p1 GENE.Phypoly_transcript_02069~~Phypoly_transcript_02069.p1  ORF type:complete len:944 (+),score=232.78 Phypoly_transcript_02069:99-2930(+)